MSSFKTLQRRVLKHKKIKVASQIDHSHNSLVDCMKLSTIISEALDYLNYFCHVFINILGAAAMSRRIRSLQQLCRALHSIPRTSNNALLALPSKRRSSTVILGQSTVLLQDGLQIQELPWVIRRLDPREFPFTRAAYAADDIRKHAEQDDAFEQLLQECKNVPQVFRLLEVPGEQVTAYSAAFALRRISQLRESTSDNIDSFIRKAILNELCETVIRDIKHLSNDALIDVVK